ncbi:Glycosyltransferase family 15 protein [Mycena sanguinolenta]|uniref:Glycosyltransferase family 15 protein n=1 Tax=Mycena sanguinolenta TaxID=230812 RepID=A0A8H7CNL7_9AGAR|nr:Glycosyltransferase family 15 protein [Mycena sanguinolenta]
MKSKMALGVLVRRRYLVALVVLISLLYFLESAVRPTSSFRFPSSADPDALAAANLKGIPADAQAHAALTNLSPTSSGPPTCFGKEHANATMLMLARNSDLAGAISSVSQIQDRFNRHCNYPWVFLNDEEFNAEFRREMSKLTNGSVSFGLVPREHWVQPDWIDEDLARAGRDRMVAQDIIYAGSVPYRNMCRFNSGFFFHHPLLQQYRYYWRVEPDIEYTCDVPYDPFRFMQDNDKVYGFTISFYEWEPTIPTLWKNVKEFITKHPEHVAPDNAMAYLSDDGGQTYNLCHFWSNFEIADMSFWRAPAYQAFFSFLEHRGGFYYERWGDAPVHSIAAALFASKSQLHFFEDIGYRHSPFQHCPLDSNLYRERRCSCDQGDTLDFRQQSCIPRYKKLFN